MAATGHASVDILAAYADGSLSEGMSLLVACHLTFCPECRERVARLEALGGALLDAAQPVPPAPRCLDGLLARLDAPEAAEPPAADPAALLPMPLRLRLGCCDIRWRFLLPGLSEYRLEGFADEDVSLVRARPGLRILAHTHCGQEATLMLKGQMRDGAHVHCRGDVALAGEQDDHHPEIVGTESCVCLVVLSGRRRFTGRFGRVLNILPR